MPKVIKLSQNKARALEVRMEQETSEKYNVILAGMTIHHSCLSGACDGGRQENFMYTENLTYKFDSFSNLKEADMAYLAVRENYVD